MPPDADSMWELNLIIGVCNLRKAHAQHVAELFEAEGCFQKALQKAFGVICNQDFAGSCTAAVLVTVCDHLLRKVSPGVALASYVPSPATWPACGQHVCLPAFEALECVLCCDVCCTNKLRQARCKWNGDLSCCCICYEGQSHGTP